MMRSPARGPCGMRAGLVPQKVGVMTIASGPASVALTIRWWPSTRQPQG